MANNYYFSSTNPPDALLIGDIPAQLRYTQGNVKVVVDKEHTAISTGTAESGGKHVNGVARVFLQSGLPSTSADGVTALGIVTGASTDMDSGRLAVDTACTVLGDATASNELKVYVTTSAGISTGWQSIIVSAVKHVPYTAVASNLLDSTQVRALHASAYRAAAYTSEAGGSATDVNLVMCATNEALTWQAYTYAYTDISTTVSVPKVADGLRVATTYGLSEPTQLVYNQAMQSAIDGKVVYVHTTICDTTVNTVIQRKSISTLISGAKKRVLATIGLYNNDSSPNYYRIGTPSGDDPTTTATTSVFASGLAYNQSYLDLDIVTTDDGAFLYASNASIANSKLFLKKYINIPNTSF